MDHKTTRALLFPVAASTATLQLTPWLFLRCTRGAEDTQRRIPRQLAGLRPQHLASGRQPGEDFAHVAAGIAVAAVVAIRAMARRRLHLLDVAGLCYFLALGAVLIAVHPGHLEFWSRYAQAGSHIALTLIVFGSILIGHPFTESYARRTAPPAVWHTRQFHAINQRISAVWGLAFLAGTISLLIAGSVGDRQVLLRVIVPFGALYLAYRYTQKQTRQARDATPPGEPAVGGSAVPTPASPAH